jgi:hypothetical protein
VDVVGMKNFGPKLLATTLDKIAGLVLEHRVVVGDRDELVVAETFGEGDISEIWIPLLAVFADHERIVDLCATQSVRRVRQIQQSHETNIILLEERLWVVVAVDADLRDGVVERWLLVALLNPHFEPRQNDLQPVPLLHLVDQLVDRDRARDRRQQLLDSGLVAVYVQKSANNLRRARGVDTLDVNLDEAGEAILVQVENQVVNEVEAVAHDDERQLVREFRLLEEVLDLLGVVEVALAADALHLADLTRASSGLNVLEVYFRVFAEVDNRPKVVV